MKKVFKKLLIPAAELVILPTVSCKNNIEQDKGIIEIVSNIEDITIIQDEDHLSKPIEVKCLDCNKQELDYELKLKYQSNTRLPDWISITDKNEIKLSGDKPVGTFTFTLSACNEQHDLYSNNKSFVVNVIDNRHIEPTNISMSMESDKYYPYSEISAIPIDVTPSKQGVEEKYLLNNIKCEVIEVIGIRDKDLLLQPLFQCFNSEKEHYLIISENTIASLYTGVYKLKIRAYLVSNPNIQKTIDTTLHIDNVYSYYDSASKCSFKREKGDEGWTISSISPDSTIIYNLPSSIKNMPVTTVSSTICSENTDIVQIILPSSVTTIQDHAFEGLSALSSLEIPGVKYVGNCAFKNCSLLEHRTGSKYPSFKVVGNEAFYNCKKYNFESLSDVLWIGENAFYNAGLCKLEVGENCFFIDNNAFRCCTGLNSFIIRAVEPPIIQGLIFTSCDSLNSIKVPIESLWDYSTDNLWKNQGKQIEGI